MASFGSTIDDPEKHFLGDLLSDDDPSQPVTPHRNTGSSGIPTAAVISGTGSVGASSFWPEPPPPYSASLQMPSWTPPRHHNINHVLHQPLKEPAQLDTFFMAGTAPPIGYGGRSQLLHEYHMQQQSYVGNVYRGGQTVLNPIILPPALPRVPNQNHVEKLLERSDSPEQAPSCPTPEPISSSRSTSARSSCSNNSMRYSTAVLSSSSGSSNSLPGVPRSSQITPPPPEPIHKMPFSYRDVAGRGASTGGAQQRSSAPVTPSSASTTPPLQKHRLGSASSAMAELGSRADVLENGDKSQKRRGLESEFQKITRKKGTVKAIDKDKSASSVLPDSGLPIDGSSKWDVLKSLSPRRDHLDSGATDMEANRDQTEEALTCPIPTDVSATTRRGSRSSSVEDPSDEVERAPAAKRPVNTKKPRAEQLSQQQNSKKQKSNKRGKNDHIIVTYLSALVSVVAAGGDAGVRWLIALLSDVLLLLYTLLAHSACSIFQVVQNFCRQAYIRIVDRCANVVKYLRHADWRRILWLRHGPPDDQGRWGLDNNIELPTTGKDAINRLMRCQGQDAYVILGLRADCSDDDIKRYYKRQSLLIHPDKNPSECAHEAFRVLQKAYEMVGHPEDRRNYNLANINKNPMHTELEELWEKLRNKMREAQSTMFCDCGKRHTRCAVESVRQAEARWCARCSVRHPAKQNDIWAESRFFGIFWVYFTCDDGQIYDISQWAQCEHNQLKHLRADSHTVQYRLVSTNPPPSGYGHMSLSSALQHMTKGADPLLTREDARMLQEAAQSASFRPPDRSNEDRPRKANNRRTRKR